MSLYSRTYQNSIEIDIHTGYGKEFTWEQMSPPRLKSGAKGAEFFTVISGIKLNSWCYVFEKSLKSAKEVDFQYLSILRIISVLILFSYLLYIWKVIVSFIFLDFPVIKYYYLCCQSKNICIYAYIFITRVLNFINYSFQTRDSNLKYENIKLFP